MMQEGIDLPSNDDTTHKVHLTGEKQTLLITLYAKAMDYRSKGSILKDKRADEIIRTIDYDFQKLRGFGNGGVMVARARQIDEWLRSFLESNPNCVILNLGCGLDTRVARISPASSVLWFDLDYPEIISERKRFFSDYDGYRMIESSITDPSWLEGIPKDRAGIIIADGVLEYLAPSEVSSLFKSLTDHFPRGQIIFDVMNSSAIESGRARLKQMARGRAQVGGGRCAQGRRNGSKDEEDFQRQRLSLEVFPAEIQNNLWDYQPHSFGERHDQITALRVLEISLCQELSRFCEYRFFPFVFQIYWIA